MAGDAPTIASGKPTRLQRVHVLSKPWAVAAYALCTIAIALLAVQAHQASALPGDIFIARHLQSIDSSVFDALMRAVSRMGFFAPSAIILCLFALGCWSTRKPVETVFILLTATGEGVNEVIKDVVTRPRPSPDAIRVFERLHDYSFPSGHVIHYVVFYGFLFFLFWTLLPGSWPRTFALFLTAALVLLIGPSRIYVGDHWPSDVLGAYLLGGLWLAFLIQAYSRCKALQRADRLRWTQPQAEQ